MRPLLRLGFLFPAIAAAHQGHSSPAPWAACEERSVGDVCSFEPVPEEQHVGTCRSMSGALVCVRNRAIVRRRRASLA